jgi:DNA primase
LSGFNHFEPIRSGLIPDEIIAEVLDRADILAVVGRVVQLKKAGTVYKGLCPFHQERSPSFTVSPTRRSYHCFGCQVHGHALDFVIRYHGWSFPEALRQLAAEVGVEVPESRPVSPQERAERDRKKELTERLLEIQDQLAAYFTDTLFDRRGARARAYLEKRGIERRAAEAFRLGYADADKARFERWRAEKNIDVADLVTLGLVLMPEEGPTSGQPLDGGYLRFRERVMFPVVDVRGEVVGFGGRILDADAKAAKYINSPETPVYTKGDHLYGAFTAQRAARREGRVILVEGNVDVIALWQAGFEGTVAAMGTALTPRQVRLLKRIDEHVVCVMDGDGAGRKAAFASLIPFLEAGVHPRAVMLPDGEDPDTYAQGQGADAFRALLESAPPLLDVFIAHEAAKHPADPPGRAAALRAIAPALARLTDPIEQALYRDKVAATLGVPAHLIDATRAEPEPRPEPRRPAPIPEPPPPEPPMDEPPADLDLAAPPGADPGPPPAPAPSPGRRFDEMPRYEKDLVDILLHFPEMVTRFADAGGLDALTDAGVTAFFSGLCEKVRSHETLNEESSIRELNDRELAAFLTGRLATKPDQTEETVAQALDTATERLLGAWRKRQLDEAMRLRAGVAAATPRRTMADWLKRAAAGGRGRSPSSKNEGAH